MSLTSRRTDQTLLQQLQISEVEIAQRMELLHLNPQDLQLLCSHKQLIEDNIDAIVDEFYRRQTEIDEISLLIGDADTLARLRTAQRKYVLDLFSGQYGTRYVNNRLRIGMVHKRIGVEPKLYLSAVRTLKEVVFKALKARLENKNELDSTLDALDKLLYFDTTLVFDTYIDSLVGEIQSAKRKTELYAKDLEAKVAERTRQLEKLAKLDPLTNIYNQRAMQELLLRELSLAKRRNTSLSFIYFDLDDFKQINDTHGHIMGDEVLRKLGLIMSESVRETDIPCRYGGDEFCIILPDCDISGARLIGEKIIAKYSESYPQYSLSMGIAETGTDDYPEMKQLIKIADEKMYQAKEHSGFQIRY